MAVSLKTRFVLVASLLACASIAAVAIAVRQNTRQEFFKFQDLERRGGLEARQRETARVAALLDGRCCDAAVVEEAAAVLSDDLGLIVADPSGAIRAQAGAGMSEMRKLTITVSGNSVVLNGVRERRQRVERFELRLDGMGVPVRLADGTAARAFVITLPGREPAGVTDVHVAAFFGSLDRTIIWIAVLCGVLGIAVTWGLARQVLKPVDVELARQETLRRNLIHDVAHELRTPLTALRCRIETLVDGLAADPRQALSGANEEVLHLSRLVDDLQELALADAGELRLDIAETNVASVTASAIAAAGLTDDARLHVEIPSDLDVPADSIRLRQILLNLLTNADRYTPSGHRITVRGRTEGTGAVAIEVANTGSALADEQRARVFDRFYRTDAARQRSTGGTGLGLAIVKSLVEAHGGRVSADTRAGETVFTVSLPRRSPQS